MRTILANARLVLSDEVVPGALVIEGGLIAAIDQGTGVPAGAEDCEGAYLAPGLVELHTDNLERHLQPRPGVRWPVPAAILAHDRELAGTGITTVFDALRVGSMVSDRRGRYRRYARPVADAILDLRAGQSLSISHFLHLRAETCSETLIEELGEFGPEDRIGILSLMDHTPGQRQFRDTDQLAAYWKGKFGMTQDDVDALLVERKALADRVRDRHREVAIEAAGRLGARLASHDDTTVEDVADSLSAGCAIAEFPTTLEAAQACHGAGLAVIMGAPNYLRGGSHSGNVSATDCAGAGCLNILSSDYVPASLLMGAVRLGFDQENLARGLETVTAAPAKAAGLMDRGALQTGLRADLMRFRMVGDVPAVTGVWSQGRRV